MQNLNDYPTIKTELASHILDRISVGVIDNDSKYDWHFHCFNKDYYIIYHSEAVKWLKKHDLDTFEAIEIVTEYENEHFGETNTKINPKSIVNMIAYIFGEELIYSEDFKNIKQLKKAMKEIINA